MKQRILLAIIVLSLMFGLPGAKSDPSDIVISITIPGGFVQEFRAGFLAMCPVPTIRDPNYVLDPNDPNDMIPTISALTEKQWIKKWLVGEAMRAYRLGKEKLGKEAAVIEKGFIH